MQRLADLLPKIDMPPDIAPIAEPTAPVYQCAACHDMGWVMDLAKWESSAYRDGLVPCPDCGHARQQARLERISGLSETMRRYTLASFIRRFPGRGDALKAARLAVNEPHGFLTFWGRWGTGKTYLLAAIVNECRGRGLASVYITVADLLDDLRQTFDPQNNESFSGLWKRICDAKVLALDEVDKFRASEWAEEKFFQLVDRRYRDHEKCLTVLATNHEVRHGARIIAETRYPGYLESRLLDGRFRVVEVGGGHGGGDVRPLMEEG